MPPHPGRLERAGDHGQRQGRRGRQGRRAGARRRRLRHQAVLPSRAGRPDPRRAPSRRAEADLAPATLEAGPVRMDVERHVVSVRGSEVSLPLKEFELLEMLLRNAGRVLTRSQLIDRVWGSRLRRGHQDARRAREAAAGQDRGRPGYAGAPDHRPGARATSSTPDPPPAELSRLSRGARPSCRVFPSGGKVASTRRAFGGKRRQLGGSGSEPAGALGDQQHPEDRERQGGAVLDRLLRQPTPEQRTRRRSPARRPAPSRASTRARCRPSPRSSPA